MDAKQKQRLKYRLHYNLRRKGNTVVAREKFVTKRAKEVSEIEKRWLSEPYLVKIGFLKRTNRGRVVTPKAYQHFKKVEVKDEN